MSYCEECGTKLTDKELENEGMVPYCPHCKQFRFPKYNVAVSMIVIDMATDKILLIQQYGRPFYILVAGYVNRGEEMEHAAVRELKEETGMTAAAVHFNRTHFFEPSNTLMCNFTVYVKNSSEMHTNSEIDSYDWFTETDARKNIKPGSLAGQFLEEYLDNAHEG